MLNFSDVKIDSIALHHIGRHVEQAGVQFSADLLPHPDDVLMHDLKQYFFSSFKEPLFYQFNDIEGLFENNPMFSWSSTIFDNPAALFSISKEMAKHLYSNSDHANIKAGDLFVFYFDDMLVDDEMLSGIGICKAESKSSFLKIERQAGTFNISRDTGIAINKVDKACLIFNTDSTEGYRLCFIDRSNQSEAHFWVNKFLMASVQSDDYFNTKQYIELTKSFVKDRMQPLYDADVMEEAGVMNKAQVYFSRTEDFNEAAYADELFDDKALATDFLNYRREYEEERGVGLQNEFDVDQAAVRKQSRFFKSVLKLDKNFHVYIHGNRDMIERGMDADGRKYYKIYYEVEH